MYDDKHSVFHLHHLFSWGFFLPFFCYFPLLVLLTNSSYLSAQVVTFYSSDSLLHSTKGSGERSQQLFGLSY